MLPYRETIDIGFYASTRGGGEYTAYLKTTVSGWRPMIAVWPCDEDPSVSNEDMLTVMGKTFAYCITDDVEAQRGAHLTRIEVDQVPHRIMFAIGSLLRRII